MRNKPYPYYDIAEVATLRDLIAYGETHGAENTIFYTGRHNDEPMSFIEAAEEIRAVGTYLQELGFQGSHIALLGENSTEWCLSYFAIANSGNVVVPLDKELSAEDLSELIEHCGCEAIFYSEKYREQIAWTSPILRCCFTRQVGLPFYSPSTTSSTTTRILSLSKKAFWISGGNSTPQHPKRDDRDDLHHKKASTRQYHDASHSGIA